MKASDSRTKLLTENPIPLMISLCVPAVIGMLGVGSASVLSRAIGKKDQNTVDKIMGNLIMMIVVCSFIITVIGTVFTRPILLLSDGILQRF